MNSQTGKWGIDLDIQYVRQIHRDYGWPHSFNLEAASREVDTWLESSDSDVERGPRGGGWPRSPDDWVG